MRPETKKQNESNIRDFLNKIYEVCGHTWVSVSEYSLSAMGREIINNNVHLARSATLYVTENLIKTDDGSPRKMKYTWADRDHIPDFEYLAKGILGKFITETELSKPKTLPNNYREIEKEKVETPLPLLGKVYFINNSHIVEGVITGVSITNFNKPEQFNSYLVSYQHISDSGERSEYSRPMLRAQIFTNLNALFDSMRVAITKFI